ncbi:unnamed protein product, partial [Mesorhabditis spiculigera]
MGPFLDLLEEYYIKRDAPAEPDTKFYVQRYTELLSDLIIGPAGCTKSPTRRQLEKKLERDNKGAWHATELKYLFDIFWD